MANAVQADPHMMPNRRPTLGMLTSQLNRGFHRAALMAVSEAVRACGANFIGFDGGVLAAAEANVLYDLIGAEAVDGVIIWSSALDWNVGEGGMEAFCRRFARMPVVSVGRAFDGIPSILVDNYQGMRAAVCHLIEHHGYRRLAFLRGPEGAREAELRFQAYCDALAEHGIPFAAELVAGPTNWERSDGPVAVREFLDTRGLRAGVDLQAIISVGDDMACGVLETLQARGIRVPDDVAVVGFNDDDEGRAILPALTTVRQPVEGMAGAAVASLMALLDGRAAPDRVTLPLELVVRRSCGCLSPGVIEAAARHPGIQEPLAARMAQVIGADAAIFSRLVDDFLGDAAGKTAGAFLAVLNDLLQRDARTDRDVNRWHGVLSVMRGDLLPDLPAATTAAAEDLWQQARVLVGETAAQARAYQRFRAEQDSRLLGDFSQHIQTAANRGALTRTLAAELPSLGVSACYLALYEDPQAPMGLASLLFAFDTGGRRDLDPDQATFPAPQLLPAGILPADAPHSLVALPLYFQTRQLGFLLLAVDGRGAAFSETFREQISSALAGLFLREDIQRAWQEAEEANRLKSRFLATVSHELRTPLSLIVGTIEMMLREEAEGERPISAALRKDVDSIHASAQHLARLISDVLDLASSQAGELRLIGEPLQLNDLMSDVALLAGPLAREKGLDWRMEIPTPLPTVWGDRIRLRQVMLNLVTNAIKFTERGAITLWAEVGKQEVVVAVSDTGMGIPAEEQEVIFNEFRQSERAARRGYGGIGLGLAISRRLVELHGGQIGVLSSGSDGAGSTFYFTLPIMAPPVQQPAAPADRTQNVLLLTERASEGERLRAHLDQRGFRVEPLVIAEHPDWLAQVVAMPPGAVVLGYEPAAERGWDIMQTLKRNPATHDIPVLFCALADGRRGGSVLALDYLTKPVGDEELARALTRQGVACDESTPKTILIVDDEPGILDLHTRIVRAHVPGCRVLAAANGVEALAAMARTAPDLVLLDLMMPEMDGFAVLRAMREHETTRRVPVIVLTAQILTREDMARLQEGVAAVLGKELFSEAEVLAQVEGALARGKRLGSDAQRIARLVMAYIHEHYADPVSREGLAQHFALNERYLTRCFSQETGIPPIAYLNRYRVQRARALLEQEQMNVTAIALATGFSDSAYFSRVFLKEMGVAPSAYRRSHHRK